MKTRKRSCSLATRSPRSARSPQSSHSSERTLCETPLVIERSQALAALAEEEFDVVVVGGGITGAGVALDAAARGYSVALLERADFASGHLQPLEQARPRRPSLPAELRPRARARGAARAQADGRRSRRTWCTRCRSWCRPSRAPGPTGWSGVGLNLYDVMAVDRDRLRSRARAGALPGARRREAPGAERRARAGEDGESWSPERHRVISGEEVLELLPALAAREPTSGYLFYDCQTDDVRLVLTVLGEAERFGAVCANRLDVTALLEQDGLARGCARARRARAVSDFAGAGRERRERDGRLGRRAAPAGAARRGRAAVDPPEPRHPHHAQPRRPAAGRRRDRARGRPGARSSRCRGSATRLIGTTDNDYEGPLEHIMPSDEDVDYLLQAVNDFFGTELAPSDLTGAFAGVQAPDRDRRPAQVGRHLAQGGAV